METITIIAAIVALAIKAAPLAKTVFDDAAQLVQTLVNKGLISKAQQQGFMDWCNAHMEATLAKTEPPEFVVVPDAPPVAPAVFGGSASDLPHNAGIP